MHQSLAISTITTIIQITQFILQISNTIKLVDVSACSLPSCVAAICLYQGSSPGGGGGGG